MRFTTLFPKLRPFALHKDVGRLPYHLARDFGWDSTLAFYQAEGEGAPIGEADFESQVELVHLGTSEDRVEVFTGLADYLADHAASIDVLNLYRFGPESALYAHLYRALNPEGICFLKLDMDAPAADMLLGGRKSWHRRAHDALLASAPIDFYTIETSDIEARVAPFFRSLGAPLYRLPNGFEPDVAVDATRFPQEKEKILLTVGRLGMPQKHSELLLEALARVPAERLEGWQIYLVGPIEHGFDGRVDAFRRAHPHLADRIHLTGKIDDRERLFDLYRRARIFCLTSRWESFAFVLLEAAYFGCQIVTTQVGAATDLTMGGELGELVDVEDVAGYARALERAMGGEALWDERAGRLHARAVEEFSWSSACRRIVERVEHHLS